VSASAEPRRGRSADSVAGYIATFSIFLAAIAIVYRPVRLAPAAAVVALVAAGMAGKRSNRIVQIAIGMAVVGWLAGMIVAVTTNRPLW
jgi:hypothetical protein